MLVFELDIKKMQRQFTACMHAHAHIHTQTHTQTHSHTALNSSTNGPQWVGYKGGDVMSVMETVGPFTSDPFLIQLSLLTQSREKERTKERQRERKCIFLFLPHPPPANFGPLKCPYNK